MDNLNNIPIIISKGNPYEIGYNHGKSCSERIHRSFEGNLKSCLDRSDIDKNVLYKVATDYIKPIKTYNKDYIEELHGISDGSGLSFEDILVLNSRTELQKIAWNYNKSKKDDAYQKSITNLEACTSIVVTGEKTIDGCTYLGQNWDSFSWTENCLIFHIIEQNGEKPSIAYCGEAGIITRSGINSYGIGSCVNSLSTNAPVNLEGVPLQILLRGVLDSKDLGEAIDAVNGGKNAAVNNIMIAHKDNEAADVEMDTGCCGVLYPMDGILTHANHYVTLGFPRYPHLDVYKGNSFIRHNRSEKLLRSIGGKIRIEDIQNVFADHGNSPQSICRHESSKDNQEERSKTVFSFIANLTTLEFYLASNNPCKGYMMFKPFDLL